MKKNIKFILSIALLLGAFISTAQNPTKTVNNRLIDSLLNQLKISSLASQQSKLTNDNDTTQINILNALSREYIIISNFEKSLKYAIQAKEQSEKVKYFRGEANAYHNMGTIYRITGIHNKAMSSFLKSLSIREAINDKPGISASYNNIGNIYLAQLNYDKALEYYLKSLKMAGVKSNKRIIATVYNNVGIIYKSQMKYEKAIEYFTKALKTFEEIKFAQGVAYCYMNLGSIAETQNSYEKSLINYLKALDILKDTEDKPAISSCHMRIGTVYITQGKLIESYNNLMLALSINKEIGNKDGLKETYSSLASLYEIKKDYKQALDYHKLYSQIKDTLLNEQSGKQISEMNAKYESEKKEKDISLLTKDQALQYAEIDRQKLIRNSFIGGLALVLILTFILLNRFKITNKQKTIIQAQNFQIVESINYSKKIQDSLLPSIETMQASFAELFVFYDPKAIVSGDFYYLREFNNHTLIACVDCTGHGVPGGFMSTLGSLLLDKITNDEALTSAEILNKLSEEIIRVLHQQKGGEIQDGMDLSLCLVNRHENSLQFSGARNGLIIVSDNTAKRCKADILPVGGNYTKKGVPIKRDFKSEQIQLKPNDWVFMYTDGFMEQVGGEDTLPMNYSEFTSHLIKATQLPGPDQKCKLLQTEFNKWCGNNHRDDDVLIIGFKKS